MLYAIQNFGQLCANNRIKGATKEEKTVLNELLSRFSKSEKVNPFSKFYDFLFSQKEIEGEKEKFEKTCDEILQNIESFTLKGEKLDITEELGSVTLNPFGEVLKLL